jgi:hypothetical protein
MKSLMRKISIEEVKQFVVEMDKGKSPSPDGFTIEFFHACWSLIKQYVLEVVEDSKKFLKVLSAPFNSTLLTLIPKRKMSNAPTNLDLYLFVMLSTKSLPKLLLTSSSLSFPPYLYVKYGFVEERQILDSIIFAHELIHSLKSTQKPGVAYQY